MKKGGGKRKGGSFEREICVKLSLWITHGEKKDCLWRSAMSGGRATVQKGVRQCGDITAVAPEGHVLTDRYSIECKHVRDLDLWGMLQDRGKLRKFWAQACADAKRHNKQPILIAKQNNTPVLFCTASEAFGWPSLRCPRLGIFIYRFDEILKTKFQP